MEDENTTEAKTGEPRCTGSALNDLLSCPCCGSDPKRIQGTNDGKDIYKVYCPTCQIRTWGESTEESACYVWNTRYLFEPAKIGIEIGETNRDNQLGNFYNAIDEVVCYFQAHSGEVDVNLSKTLRLLADRLDEC